LWWAFPFGFFVAITLLLSNIEIQEIGFAAFASLK